MFILSMAICMNMCVWIWCYSYVISWIIGKLLSIFFWVRMYDIRNVMFELFWRVLWYNEVSSVWYAYDCMFDLLDQWKTWSTSHFKYSETPDNTLNARVPSPVIKKRWGARFGESGAVIVVQIFLHFKFYWFSFILTCNTHVFKN